MEKRFIYDLMLPYFLEEDYRPITRKVHADKNGYLYAANGYGLIRMKRDLTYRQYDEIPGYPAAENIMRSAIDREGNKSSVVKTDDLLRLLSAASWSRVRNTDSCEKCEGIGRLECKHCGSDYECSECNGAGRVPASFCDEMAVIKTDERYLIKMGETVYDANYLYPVALMARMLNIDEIQYLHRSKKEGGVFSFGGADILIMPDISDRSDAEITLEQIPPKSPQTSQAPQTKKTKS